MLARAGHIIEPWFAALARPTEAVPSAADYLDGSRNSDCNPSTKAIRVEARNEPAQQVKKLAHELSRAILHGDDFKGTREITGLEAESVAFIVRQKVGLDSSAYSFGNVASWIGGGPEAIKAITACGQRTVCAARQILDSGCASVEVAARIRRPSLPYQSSPIALAGTQ